MALRILLVDDQVATRQIVRFNLEQAGFEVLDATDGLNAWNLLQTQQFDLLVTDEGMPRLCGLELCAKIRQTPCLADLPIILITGTAPAPSRDTIEKIGISHMFTKPFSPRELVEKACAILSGRTLATVA